MKFSSFAEHGFQYLLVCFFLYFMLGPFIEVIPFAPVILNLFLSALLILAVYTIHKKSHMIKGSISLLTVTLVLLWIGSMGLIEYSAKAASILLCVYLCSLVYSFGQYIFAAKRVDTNLISATLCLYLILGVLWGTIYATVEAFMPGSFTGELLAKAGTPAEQLHYFYYFSYVTLTTLGYGDILPQSRAAAALCQVEAILGQFFTAVLVARLVGIEVAQKNSTEASD